MSYQINASVKSTNYGKRMERAFKVYYHYYHRIIIMVIRHFIYFISLGPLNTVGYYYYHYNFHLINEKTNLREAH